MAPVLWTLFALLAVAAVLFLAAQSGGRSGRVGQFFSDLSAGSSKARTWVKQDRDERPGLREVFAAPETETVHLDDLLEDAWDDSGYLEPADITDTLARAKDKMSGAFRRAS